MNEKLKKVKVFSIKPFKNVRIGDPWYFEEKDEQAIEKLCCVTNTRCCKVGIIRLQQVEERYEGLVIESIYVDIFLAGTEAQLLVYLQGKYYKDTIKQKWELGCDTAHFEMEIDGAYDKFSTGADGYYGEATKFKEGYGFHISLVFDADLYTLEEVEKRMRGLFNFI